METLKDAKDKLILGWEKGTDCPCCGQFVKLYKRLFDSGLARFMIALYKLSDGKPGVYIDKDAIRFEAGLDTLKATNYGIIKHWQVAHTFRGDNTAKRTSGQWSLTEYGKKLVEGSVSIPKYAFTYNKEVYKFSKERITIKGALGKHFNYAKLMEIY
jgi:hypothetical protein